MTDINKVLESFAQEVAGEFPDLRDILDRAACGSLSEEDALRHMNEVLCSNPEFARRFQQMALSALAPVAGREVPQPLDHDGLIVHKQRGLPRLNPLVEAALIERAQFDDDMPELRTGPLPPGVQPAVAVDTDVRNPAALGRMLSQASGQVAEKVAEGDRKYLEMVREVAEGDVLSLIRQAGNELTRFEVEDHVFDGKLDLHDPPEYKRGHVPAPVQVARPTGAELLGMTPAERRQSAWKFLSTTQGRRTAVGSIWELVEVKLRSEGFDVVKEAWDPVATVQVAAHHEWTTRIDGPNSTQSSFSLIDIAAACIAKGLTKQLGEWRGLVLLDVVAVNTVDVRAVGWAGRLMRGDHALRGPE